MESNYKNLILSFVFILSVGLLVLQNGTIHAEIVGFDLSSNVTIQKSLAISFSSDLEGGIIFEEVHFLPSFDVNASKNYVGENQSTNYYVLVSSDGNVNVDLCIKADGDLINSVGDRLNLTGETYSSSLNSSLFFPDLNDTSLSLFYVKAGEPASPGQSNFLRFWLDVPGAQPPGTYSNSIFLKAISSGPSC